jgi:3-oxoacyl-[acyl-carrier-protein] synthase III
MTYARIAGTGSYLPSKILTNHDLEKLVNTTHEWIVERTGIHERRIAAPGETSASMGLHAAQKAIEAAQISPQDIDLIIVATSTGENIFPSTACLIQHGLGISGCPAFDVTAACAGFNYAISIADQFIRTQSSRCALIIGSEVMSRIVDWQDRNTCVLFADGAGAMILTASETPGIHSTHLHADGQHKDLLYAPNGIDPTIKAHLHMSGREVFKIATQQLATILKEALVHNQIDQSAIKWLIPHQANLRIIAAMAKILNLPMDRIIVTLDKYGNTSAASVPLALDHAIRDGRIQRGDLLLLESWGGGLAWGSALVTY